MDYMYGQLYKQIKEIEYKGRNSETTVVTVDQKTKTIRVDVKILSPEQLPKDEGNYVLLVEIDENGNHTLKWVSIQSTLDRIKELEDKTYKLTYNKDTDTSTFDSNVTINKDLNVEGNATFNNKVTISNSPVDATDATNKQFVEEAIEKSLGDLNIENGDGKYSLRQKNEENSNTASGENSAALGIGTEAKNQGELAVGKYGKSIDDTLRHTLFTVGAGTEDSRLNIADVSYVESEDSTYFDIRNKSDRGISILAKDRDVPKLIFNGYGGSKILTIPDAIAQTLNWTLPSSDGILALQTDITTELDKRVKTFEYVDGEGDFTNVSGGLTVKGRLNVDNGIYSSVNLDDPKAVVNKSYIDNSIQDLIDNRIGAFTRTADKSYTDVTGGMTIKGHLNVDDGITSSKIPENVTDVPNKQYVDTNLATKLDKVAITSGKFQAYIAGYDENGSKQLMVDLASDTSGNSIAQRDSNGRLQAAAGTVADDVATFGQLEDRTNTLQANIDKKIDLVEGDTTIALKNNSTISYTSSTTANTIMQRDSNGRVKVEDGINNKDAVNKGQLDTKLDLTGGTLTGNLTIQDADVEITKTTEGKGNLTVGGNLKVNGTTTTVDTETLAVKDNLIIANADNTELVNLSGLAIKTGNKDADENAIAYGILYDPATSADSVKLGLGSINKTTNEFTFKSATDANPVATRDNSTKLTDSHLLVWNSAKHTLIDANNLVDSITPASLGLNNFVLDGGEIA